MKDNGIKLQRINAVKLMENDVNLHKQTQKWFDESCRYTYSYNFDWLGIPIIQYPQDIVAMQEIIWQVKPDIIIETGVAHGGSLVLYASLLKLLGGDRKVVGIDIDIRQHNREKIESHPVFDYIELIEGSSIDHDIAGAAAKFTENKKNVLVILDSNHTHEHVLKELELYSPLVTKNSYLIVFDTVIEDMPEDAFPNRPWGIGDNPKTAVHEFLKNNQRFEIDKNIQHKLQITVAPDGYLKCIAD